ncbi:MAG TPA: AarF/ABC1/UbiB kinase family protein [Syntrophomonadaceae bacterium]|nr:AarF/ABC1/UbiB kinase family protein [Syntrophomonadaceae bacterium]HNX28371.1 AarF/ABC1/UbiB kinase family protein [Syntrophomonadaceae bacterium]HPR92697.1 AarF/ABC1/UbiB kinase family protein [Syntrophomonadaceae bacterium]
MNYWWQLKYIRRRREIVKTFVRHGLGFFVQRAGLGDPAITALGSTLRQEKTDSYLLAVNLREALMELGPTFVKLGQLLSTRSDILPPIFIEELEKLQDKVTPISYEEISKVITEELGSLDAVFSYFDPEPLAAASIGQVHRACLKSGEDVIVKVQRPAIEEIVRNDLEIIKGLARISERRSAEARQIGVNAVVEDFAKTLLRELDYEREARNTEQVFNNFADDKRVMIPRIYKRYSTPRVLIEDYIEGYKLSDIENIDRLGWSRYKLSKLGTEAFLSQILLHGFFQADPHPGNILAVNEHTIAFIDFGEIGYLGERRLMFIGELLMAISKKDPYRATSVLRDMGILENIDDIEAFSEDLGELLDGLMNRTIGNIDIKTMRTDIMDLAYRYQLKMPPYLTSLMKALITVEGLGKKLDSNFDFSEVAGPLAKKVYAERLKPNSIARYIKNHYYQDIKPLTDLPMNFNKLLKKTGDGRLSVNLQMEFTPRANRKITQLVSRLGFAVITTGALIGSALVLQTNHSPAVDEFAFLGIIGFSAGIIGLIVFLISSLRN